MISLLNAWVVTRFLFVTLFVTGLVAGCVDLRTRVVVGNTAQEPILFSLANEAKNNEMSIVVNQGEVRTVLVADHARRKLPHDIDHNTWLADSNTLARARGIKSGFEIEKLLEEILEQKRMEEVRGKRFHLLFRVSESDISPLEWPLPEEFDQE